MRDENEMLQSDLEKMKKKYSELKKVAGRMSSDMKTEREAFIDSISKVSSSATARWIANFLFEPRILF